MSYQKIRKIFIFFIIISICNHHALGKEIIKSTDKNTDKASDILHRYVQLRLNDADWKEYAKFITWADEPSWDCVWVVGSYEIDKASMNGHAVKIPVVYKRLGKFCYDFDFQYKPEKITINYKLIDSGNGWKVNLPIPDYPDISAEAIINSLKIKAKNLNESSDDENKKINITVTDIENALKKTFGGGS